MVLSVRSTIEAVINGKMSTDVPATQNEQPAKSMVKTLLIAFDHDGIIQKECAPAGQAVNAVFYSQVFNGCSNASAVYDQSCTGQKSGCCCTITCLHMA
ncbi:hypothetical protein PR048_004854 [Dryococelus australis]|uniref:Uncharacterized protein n=1 Tax=Dryococelus australis TaxID=614101 RepID=A0ABQ9I6L0_9NEOP|nr:hypothetical protein PR048_004854 [Dryococelus australis]